MDDALLAVGLVADGRALGAEIQVTHQLFRYVGRMGEPLFLAQPPTGYPDVTSSWISPDMLLSKDMKMKIYSIAGLYSSVGYVVEQRYIDQDMFVKPP